MPDFDAMPSSSRCQLLAAMGGLALVRTTSAQDTAPRRNPGAARGLLIAIGGVLRVDHTAVWLRIVQEAGGPGNHIGVLATASDSPERIAAGMLSVHPFAADWLRIVGPGSRKTAAAET